MRDLLSEQRPKLDSLARALLDAETLDQEQAYAAAGVAPVGGRSAAGSRGLSGGVNGA